MKRAVAIVGRHPRTREAAPWEDVHTDIWVCNDYAREPWVRRKTAVFEMHPESTWRTPVKEGYIGFLGWLQMEHPYPIYMLRKYKEIPASVEYPLDEVCQDLLYKFQQGEERPLLFSSSICYAMALAIHLRYYRIEIYGVEMESESEYAEQRNEVYFWAGVALGFGMQVAIHEDSQMFRSRQYGYELEAV